MGRRRTRALTSLHKGIIGIGEKLKHRNEHYDSLRCFVFLRFRSISVFYVEQEGIVQMLQGFILFA